MHRFPTSEGKAIGHVEKEVLALIFAGTRFHKMLLGRHFLLQTDHQPLLKFFGSKKGIPVYTANRLQRWALTLLLYDFDIHHVSSTKRQMSSHHRPDEDYVIAAVYVESVAKAILNDTNSNLPVTHQIIVAETRKGPVLQQVVDFLNKCWPVYAKQSSDPDVKKFFARRDGLQFVSNCVMFVPTKFHKRGSFVSCIVERMKSLAHSCSYWPTDKPW
ncbi:uncharacterized protein LOC135716760 [Ochlerotatus camptorhynchus]|uniref:uncharacterized protein LOC135716760 n=1 Tax=Ochlerotatus camptorhynchus TaxID=644619 RepID=UPI0031D0D964